MNTFRNLRIAHKLALGFSAVLAMCVLVSAIGISRIAGLGEEWSGFENGALAKREVITRGANVFGDTVHHFKNYVLRGGDYEAKVSADLASLGKVVADYRAVGGLNADEEKALGRIAEGASLYRAAVAKVGEMQAQKASVQDIDKSIKGADKPIAEGLAVLEKRSKELTTAQGVEIGERVESARRQLLGTALVAVLAAIVFAVLIVRAVVPPLRSAVSFAEGIAAGKLDATIPAGSKDEVGALLRAFSSMQDQIKRVIEAQKVMADRHEEGTTSYRIPAGQLPGAFGELAERVNTLVASHIAVNMEVVKVVGQYAHGDLSADMDKLPGEQAKINEAIDGVKAQLQGLNQEIQTLVSAAAKGDFSARGDEGRFEYGFRDMVHGLNTLMESADAGLTEVARVLQTVSQGDLTQRVEGDLQGKFADLKDDTNKTVDQLARVIGQIREASETINLASKEIAQGNADLSQRTEEQASSLEETASSMEELTSTVKQNAENARQANQLASGASDVAVKGGEVVGQVVTTMTGISESSRKIADIIGVIDGIAFQTNILALNAAVEAARAGEQGRGFAVVASEVRSLAQRSANAAKEIKTLIEDSVGRVDAGTRLVNEAGRTMDELVGSVKRVTDIMAEITAASQEQSAGIEQVNQAVTQMDEVTQQNAALVEQAAAAAESLQEQAGGLVQSVAVFRVSANDAAVASASAASWDGQAERRSADRAKNVARIAKPGSKPAARPVGRQPVREPKKLAAAGGADDWSEF